MLLAHANALIHVNADVNGNNQSAAYSSCLLMLEVDAQSHRPFALAGLMCGSGCTPATPA